MADIYHLTLHPPVLCQADAFKPSWQRRHRDGSRPGAQIWGCGAVNQRRCGVRTARARRGRGGSAYRVIQSIDVQHHRFGPFVAGAQKEMSFTLAGGGLPFRSLSFFIAGRLQNLVDLRSQQFGFPGRRVPLVWETDTHSGDRTL